VQKKRGREGGSESGGLGSAKWESCPKQKVENGLCTNTVTKNSVEALTKEKKRGVKLTNIPHAQQKAPTESAVKPLRRKSAEIDRRKKTRGPGNQPGPRGQEQNGQGKTESAKKRNLLKKRLHGEKKLTPEKEGPEMALTVGTDGSFLTPCLRQRPNWGLAAPTTPT